MASEDWFLRLDPYNFNTEKEFNEFHYGDNMTDKCKYYVKSTKNCAIDLIKCKNHRTNCYYKQLKLKEQEVEKLKEWQEANKATGICETCTHKTLLKNDELRHHVRELDRLNAKYKQTLDKIEKLTDIREVHGLTDAEYVENFRLHQKRILNIINKVKEN